LKKADVKTEVYAAPPAAKEKLLKKFLFGISSKRFNSRRERIASALLLPPQINPPSTPPIIEQRKMSIAVTSILVLMALDLL